MKEASKIILTLSLIILLFACNRNQNERIHDTQNSKRESTENIILADKEEEISGALSSIVSNGTNTKPKDATTNQFISSSAAVESGKDSTRRFIRTAELKFKVKSVINATYTIEGITGQQGGFVASTSLTSHIDYQTTTSISADSSVESAYFTVVNDMILRVPNTKLDTTLKSIAILIDYLDYRKIKADDVAIQILSNKLVQERATRSQQRLKNAIDNRGKKLTETTDAEQLLSDKEDQADNAKIANLTLQDQINFSTIKLSIYQRQTVKRELISNDKNINAYKPGLGSRFVESLREGWEILESIVLFLTQLWGLILFALIAIIVYKAFRLKRKQ